MDKSQIPNHRLPKSSPSPTPIKSRPPVWDCNSALYDSFELTSFQRHLDSALTATNARTLSMPHRTDLRRGFRLSSTSADHQKSTSSRADSSAATSGSKLSRSFQKLLRSVFSKGKGKGKRGGDRERFVENETTRWFVVYEDGDGGVLFDKDRKEKGAALSAIAEAPEAESKAGLMSPEISAAVRKTVSERFTAASVSNHVNLISSCA